MICRKIQTLLLAALVLPLCLKGQNQGPTVTTPLPDQMLDQGGASIDIDLLNYFEDPDVTAPAVQLDMIYSGKTEPIYLALFWEETPITAQNFVDYIDAGRFAENLIHRSVPGFIIQGGGFRFAPNLIIEDVPSFAEIQNEPGISNTRGTVAMAKRGGAPNSATNQWFINMNNNASTLDGQNGGFTAFARVLGDGMDVADEIEDITVYDTSNALGGAFAELPLTAFSLERTSFVETNASLVDPLQFSALSSNPEIVAIDLDSNGTLRLSPAANNSGEATITIVVKDLDDASRNTNFKVTVISNIEAYADWQTNQSFPDDAAALVDADPDFDGWNNLMEYTFGTSPLQPNSLDQFFTPLGNGYFRATFREDVSSEVHIQTSQNLNEWTTSWKTTNSLSSSLIVSSSKVGELRTVTLRPNPFNINLIPRYWRLLVTEGEE